MRRKREIEAVMAAEGFWLKRRRGHSVWTDGLVTIVTAASASDWRAIKNIKGRGPPAAGAA